MKEKEFELVTKFGEEWARKDWDELVSSGVLNWDQADIERAQSVYKQVVAEALAGYDACANSLSASQALAVRIVISVVDDFASGSSTDKAFEVDGMGPPTPKHESRKAFAKFAEDLREVGLGYNESVRYLRNLTNATTGQVRSAMDQHGKSSASE